MRASRGKEETLWFFLYVFKVHVLWDSKYEGGNGKKIPVFVSKFGEIVFFFFISLCYFLSFYRFFFQKETLYLQNVGGQKEQRRIYITMETGAFVKNKLHSSSIIPEY